MHDFWNQLLFDNPVKKYFYVAGAILLGLIIRRALSRFVAGLLYRIPKSIGSGIDKNDFIKLLTRPLETFLVVFIVIASIEKLKFPVDLEFEIYEVTSKTIVQAIAKTVLIASFIWLLLRAIDFIAMLLKQKARAAGDLKDHQLVVFFRDFLKVIIGIIGILMILGMAFGFEVSKLWTGLGIAGAALALSLKESIENLIASFIIFFDKPFTTGDVLKVNGITGTVERIGLRSTRIRTDQKTYVTVPNKQMVDSIVDNQTLRSQRKAELRLQIGLSTSAELIRQFIQEVNKIMQKDLIESPSVILNDISGTAFELNIDYFTPPVDLQEFNDLKQEVNLEILRLLEAMKISIAGYRMDVNLRSMPSSQEEMTGSAEVS